MIKKLLVLAFVGLVSAIGFSTSAQAEGMRHHRHHYHHAIHHHMHHHSMHHNG